MRFKVALAALAASACLTACSSSNRSIDNARLEVISDCVTPTADVYIQTANGNSISGVDFATLGFPTSTVHLGQDNAGPYNNGMTSVTRVCEQTYGANDTGKNTKYVFSCSDDGEFACSITLIAQ